MAQKPRFLLFLVLLSLVLAACQPQAQPTPLPSPTSPPLPPTATVEPSSTPPPGKLLLVGAAGADVRDWLSAQAAQAGLTFEERAALAPGELPAEARAVVWFDPPADLSGLPAAAPQVQFAAVTSAPLEPSTNLSVIRAAAGTQAFAAGYLAVLLSDDWRSAGLIPSDQPDLVQAFENGGGYFCGDCAPGWPLGSTYPMVGAAATASDGATWAVDANNLFDGAAAEVFYLSSAAYKPEVYASLAGRVQIDQTVIVFGSQPPPDELRAQWAATLSADALAPLQQALPEMLAGRSVGSLAASVALRDVNPDLFSPGRQALFEKMLADLQSGLVQVESVN